jgi:hypothetical protein
MKASLRALLAGIIDYAGLFPPAQLLLDQAVRNYLRYRQEPESWMLARFICPAAKLEQLANLLEESAGGSGFVLSVLAEGGKTVREFLTGIEHDLSLLSGLREGVWRHTKVELLEVRFLPFVDARNPLPDLNNLAEVNWELLRNVLPSLKLFHEIALGADWRSSVADALRNVKPPISARFPELREQMKPWQAGVKLRCGGLQASAFPTPEQVAFTISACRDAAVSLKFTAGLHHPIRHFDTGLQTKMHGFINVFVAGVLACARGLGAEQLQSILEDEDARHFIFTDDGLRWKDHQATTDEIGAARQNFVTSFGSCSFDEPRDDLRALGWL